MYKILFLVGVAAMVALVVGMINPRWVFPNAAEPAPRPSRWRVLIVYSLAWWGSWWLGGQSIPDSVLRRAGVEIAADTASEESLYPMTPAQNAAMQRQLDSLEGPGGYDP